MIKFCQNCLDIKETNLILAIVEWGKNKTLNYKEYLKNILPHILLPLVPEDDLKNIIEPLNLFSKEQLENAKKPNNFQSGQEIHNKFKTPLFHLY